MPLTVAALAAVGALASYGGTNINPALQYYQAFLLAPDLPAADRDYLATNMWRGQRLPDRFGSLVSRFGNQFEAVRRAVQATAPCDWGIDQSAGPYTLLPQLGRVRGVIQNARLRAMWALQQGRQADACEDLLAGLTLARRASSDRTLISILVQIAGENIVCGAIAENFYQLNADSLKQLAAGFDAAPPRGTMSTGIAMEKSLSHDWLKRRIMELQRTNPAPDAATMALLHEVYPDVRDSDGAQETSSTWRQLNDVTGGSSAGALRLLEEEEPLFDRLAKIAELPVAEYEQQVTRFAAELRQSKNPLVAETFPAIEKARPREFGILAELAMVRAAIEYRLNGPDGLQKVIDPCGSGPFELQRFVFEGVERGFQLKSAYAGRGFPEVMIFVERDGPAFNVNGRNAGKAATQ